MHRFLSVVLGFFLCTYMAEASPRDCMVVHFADGSKLMLPIANEPRIYIDGGVVTISTDHYQFSNIRKYTFEDSDNTAISSIEGSGKYSLSKEDSQLTLKLSDKNTRVRVYTLNGMEIPVTMNTDKTATVNLKNCSENVLLLQIGSETIKVLRR